MKDDQTSFLSRSSDQQVRDLSPALTSCREEPLHLARPPHMTGVGLDQSERTKRLVKRVPLTSGPG
jgi:hypothetical protein